MTITNVPKQCTRTDFKLKVKVSDASGIDHTDVFLDGKRIKRSSKKSFSATIRAKGLSPGRHKIRVVSTDNAGNTRTRKASFQVCEPRRDQLHGLSAALASGALLAALTFGPAPPARAGTLDLPGSVQLSNERTFTRWAYAAHALPIREAPKPSSSAVASVSLTTRGGAAECLHPA